MAEDRVARAMAMDGASGGSAVQSDWAQSDSTADDYIKNKPTLGTAAALNMDAALSGSSTNPVQNKAVKAETDKLGAGLAAAVDAGAKNCVDIAAGSYLREKQTTVLVPSGEYILFLGTLASDDTDATVCQIIFRDADLETIVEPKPTRGTNVAVNVTLDRPCTKITIRASNTYANAEGDTLTIADVMLCTKAAWDASQAYEPYAPTNRELYEMILALQT